MRSGVHHPATRAGLTFLTSNAGLNRMQPRARAAPSALRDTDSTPVTVERLAPHAGLFCERSCPSPDGHHAMDIARLNLRKPLRPQCRDQMAADDRVVAGQGRVSQVQLLQPVGRPLLHRPRLSENPQAQFGARRGPGNPPSSQCPALGLVASMIEFLTSFKKLSRDSRAEGRRSGVLRVAPTKKSRSVSPELDSQSTHVYQQAILRSTSLLVTAGAPRRT